MNSTPFSYLEHLITLLLPTFTLNFLLSHNLPNSLTILPNFSSESDTSPKSSANSSWFISNLALFISNQPPYFSQTWLGSSPYPSTLTFTTNEKVDIRWYYCLLLIVCGESNHIHVQVRIGGFKSSVPIFVAFVRIWTNLLWLDRVMMFWFMLSLKSLIYPISQSSVSMALVAPKEAEELHSWCLGYGSLC